MAKKEITLSDLLAAKSKRKTEMTIDIPHYGKTTAYRLSTRRFSELSKDATDGIDKQVSFSERFIYESIPIFRAKELREGVDGEPEEVVSQILTMDEMSDVVEQLMKFYITEDFESKKNDG